ncbi:hemin uptake protein HemP [Methylobacter sp. sgz302048]|uniref:hemin uptake protein HemP n=1 Tax=Methylobacter sp. sgz302048 TaxID=3455945 RepID=UPI003FA06B1F
MNSENNKNFRRQSLVIEDLDSAPEHGRFNRALFSMQNEIVINHHDDEYRLRITSNGKLILTK